MILFLTAPSVHHTGRARYDTQLTFADAFMNTSYGTRSPLAALSLCFGMTELVSEVFALLRD